MKAVEIVGDNKPYTREEIKRLIAGNLCRCTGYMNIVTAIEHAIYNNMKKQGKDYKLSTNYQTYLDQGEDNKNKMAGEILKLQSAKDSAVVQEIEKR